MKSQKPYVVHKFGGSSLADAANFAAVKKILTGKNEVIVVSATKGTTSELQTILDVAKEHQDYLEALNNIKQRHITLAKALLTEASGEIFLSELQADFNDIENILRTVELTGDYSKQIQDLILGYGEQWCAKILAAYLANDAKTNYLDATKVLYINEKQNFIAIDWNKSDLELQKFLKDKDFDQLIVTGFIAATPEGKRTILGRNGGDYSAAIFAKLFHATELIIWTDVDGIFSADPRKVRSAFAIENLSYDEAFELAYFGAKVIHPSTIGPAFESGTPIYIKNSLNPSAAGTRISVDAKKSPHPIRGLSSIDDIALVNIEGAGMIGVSGIAARVFHVLHQSNISVILISQASSEHSICFAIRKEQAEMAVTVLCEHFRYEIEQQYIQRIYADINCAILAVIGESMVGMPGIAGKLCSTLAKASVNIRAISQGSSEKNISVVINNHDIVKALRAVHAGFYLSPKTISIGIIGPGQVGATLLQQIYAELAYLKEKYNVNLCVRGIMNSKKMLLTHEAINIDTWKDALESSNKVASIEKFIEHIVADEIPHAVIIDCTASQKIADHYLDFVKQGAHVITPNKRVNSGDINYYKNLKSLAQQTDKHYLYETTVCAGLPVIKTLQDLIQTGDKIIKIEGVVSGTLAYIFSELAKGQTFSSAVLQAKKLGFTEPDPRDDLSGMDIARKVICLAREMGQEVNIEDIKVHDLVPSELKNCSIEEFLQALPNYDEQIMQLVKEALAKKERINYVATINADGNISVDINSYPESHSFSNLQGTDNLLIFHTKRYHTQPLIIQGPGAGTEVTAAGIFADVLRLVSFLS